MSGESLHRSSLIDITYQQLHTFLTGRRDGGSAEQISQKLTPRISQVRDVSKPYGKPTPESRKTVESGTVTLPDGCILQVDDVSKEFTIALSSHFEIDEIQAFILLRSFLFNEGPSISSGSSSDKSLVEELIAAITPFYYSERLFLLRVLIPLFRAQENPADPIHAVAAKNLPNILPDGRAFADSLVAAYLQRTQESIPNTFSEDSRAASRWAKQNSREQLAMLEVLFWTMWGYAPCEGELVVKLLETAYNTNLGTSQQNSTLLLDEEGMQILQDIAGLWMLITIEILELERVAEPDGIEISAAPADKTFYTASPDSLKRIHDLVTSNPGNQHACTYLGWAFVLSRIGAKITDMKEVPDSYHSFYDSTHTHPSRGKEREPTYVLMGRVALSNEVGLFKLLHNLLTTSPLFVTAVAWKTGSTVTDPNAIAFRSVLKGFLMAVVELVPVELIPDFDSLVEVWIALFGRSESRSVAGICRQFWQSDWRQGVARRAIIDVARSRFPIHFRPLIRLLRAMTASGFLDTDPLCVASSAEYSQSVDEEEEAEREICAQHVFYYMDQLPTFSLVIPHSSCTGPNAVYERVQYGRSASAPGLTYTNVRAIRLPGGSTMPPRSTGRLLSGDGGEFVAVCWQHEYSGWKVVLDVLTEYVTRRSMYAGTTDLYQDVTFGRTGPGSLPLTLRLEDVGMETSDGGDEALATDALDLIRSVIQDKPILAQELLDSLETGDSITQTENSSADLVQLTTMILEEALSRPQPRGFSRTQLVTSAMSVLSALLTLPKYSLRVWLYIRSATALFGPSRSAGFAAVALPAERVTGQYTMTLALLNLVQQLLQEAFASVLTIPPDNQRLRQVKEEVIMRSAIFVHGEIWVEHLGWKYVQLGDRFEIGRRISSFYANILFQSPPAISDRPFPTLSQAVIDTFLHKATTSTINPLVSAIAASPNILGSLYNARRFGDVRRLIYLLESHLQLARLVLNYKQVTPNNNKPSLLEQALCAKVAGGAGFSDSVRARVDPVDVLATFVKERDVGTVVPLEAMRVLHALCASLSFAVPSPPTIIGHLSNPEATVASLVRIVEHPYEEFSLRSAVWSFISLAVDKEPALSKLLVTGEFIIPNYKGKEKEGEKERHDKKKSKSALEIATETLGHWKDLWEANPPLLASVLHFIHVVWQHGLEHQSVIESARQNKKFWDQIAAITREELGPDPDYTVESFVAVDGERQSNLHQAVSVQAYRGMVKSYAIRIIGQDIFLQPAPKCASDPLRKPLSYTQFTPSFRGEDQLNELILEGASSCYDPSLYDKLSEQLSQGFSSLSLEQLQSQDPVSQREFGDNFTFSLKLLRSRLQQCVTDEDGINAIEKQVLSINLNLSLAHAQTAMAEAWQFLLKQMLPFIRVEQGTRPSLLALASTISAALAQERRQGDMMATIHGVRLSLLLSVLEVVWFSTTDTDAEVESFMMLVTNVHELLQNEAQPPSASFLGKVSVPFHRTLLQILYFCVRQCRNLAARPKVVNGAKRLKITGLLESTLNLVVDALRLTFDSARTRLDLDLDRDMELLVAVFEQCTRPDVSASSLPWLTRCQETDVIKSSLELLVRTDIAGSSDIPLLRARRMPLYSPHIFLFHMALVSIPSGAERFASEGVVAAYSNNSISAAISDGLIDVALPELPGERSPAHKAYCYMLSIVAGVIYALGNQHHFFSADACGMIQLYGKQIARALSWSIGDPITLPLLEEMEQSVNLFHAIVESVPPTTTNPNPVVTKVLRVFSTRALVFLQQLNYALTHPNHLARLLEPVTPEERAAMEKEPMDSSFSQLDMMDLRKHPLTARLVHMTFRLCSSIVSTLISVSRAYDVLLKEQEEWPLHEALIVPHSKVVLGEPTSLGTLLELANCTLDVLRNLVSRPAGQAIVPSTSIKDTPLAVSQATLTARRTLEALLIYAVTQLAMWLSKPDFDPAATEAEAEEHNHSHNAQLDASKGRAPRALAERLRRGMTGEMTADLQALLMRAKPVLAKSEEVLGKSEGGKDLTQVLLRFLTERIVVPA
ncbi:nucleoporin subcomplex protein binding to Pom34-domain-containing protein [Butyriboletus roseoflavus]|nr:nucleoporin subcomplex protein binding to Pom34-domain-containing protein [Butyriboletus roseoflavus]